MNLRQGRAAAVPQQQKPTLQHSLLSPPEKTQLSSAHLGRALLVPRTPLKALVLHLADMCQGCSWRAETIMGSCGTATDKTWHCKPCVLPC